MNMGYRLTDRTNGSDPFNPRSNRGAPAIPTISDTMSNDVIDEAIKHIKTIKPAMKPCKDGKYVFYMSQPEYEKMWDSVNPPRTRQEWDEFWAVLESHESEEPDPPLG